MNDTETEAKQPKRPSHDVLVVDESGEKKHWTRIGAAFPNGDGKGFNILLNALPLDRKLVLRIAEPKAEETSQGGQQ